MTGCSRKKRTAIWILALITLGGLGLRLASCFWGYPMALHPDEFTIVDNAIDMLRRHSWLAFVYNRPDQFEIKCNARRRSEKSKRSNRKYSPTKKRTHNAIHKKDPLSRRGMNRSGGQP